MAGIDEYDRIDAVQRSVLPFFNILQNLVCHTRYEALTAFKPIDLFDLLGDLPGCQPSGIHAYDFVVYAGDILLSIFYDSRFECAVSILGHIDLEFPVIATDGLCLGPVTIVV